MPDTYDLYQRGLALLERGDSHAAATVLERAVSAEPAKGSLRECLGRAYYATKRFRPALEQFRRALDINPADHYAHFAAGLCLARLGRHDEAVGHLKLANVMHPGTEDYARALRRTELQRRRAGPPS